MDDAVRSALEIGPGPARADKLVDITTYGARTGEPRRIEIVFHRLDGRWYQTGIPGPRGWYANLRKDPRLVFHLKHGVLADVPATARPITEDYERALGAHPYRRGHQGQSRRRVRARRLARPQPTGGTDLRRPGIVRGIVRQQRGLR